MGYVCGTSQRLEIERNDRALFCKLEDVERVRKIKKQNNLSLNSVDGVIVKRTLAVFL